MPDRHLGWKGSCNSRDLGGLPIVDGARTRSGAIVRSDSLQGLEAQGWEEVEAYGIRTVVDALSDERLRPLYLSRGGEDEGPKIAEFLRSRGTTASDLIVGILAALDVLATLLEAGLEEQEVVALRRRLLP